MPYRVTKVRKGRTTHPDYPNPHPQSLEAFKTSVSYAEGKTITDFLDHFDANLGAEWQAVRNAVRAVLTSAPVDESFDSETQEHTIVRDWPSEEVFWAYNDATSEPTTGWDWSAESPLVEILGQNGQNV
jgi:hypothetical protein